MVGLLAVVSGKKPVKHTGFAGVSYSPMRYDSFAEDTFLAECSVLNKFIGDKEFYVTDDYVVMTDGVVLNLSSLLQESKQDRLAELLIENVKNSSLDAIIDKMRGSFCGIIYERKSKIIITYTDHFATKTLFYYQSNDFICIASEVKSIVECLKSMSIEYAIDMIGAYAMLTYGCMYYDHTIINNVRRIREGTILHIENNIVSEKKYHDFQYTPRIVSRGDAVDNINALFQQAVELQCKKNEEGGFIDVVPLSAGMDSRMTAFATKKMSSLPILNFTYSETEQYDQIYPAKIARTLGNRWLFKSLDNGIDLINIEESILIADGLIKYDWPSQLIDFLKLVDTSDWGIVHTGVIGDIIVGLFDNPRAASSFKLGDGVYSQTLISELANHLKNTGEKHDDSFEKGIITNRAINGACLGYSRTFRLVAEDLSPFMNVDFADYCFSLPKSFREDHSIYYEWVKKYYPGAAEFKHNGIRIDGKRTVSIRGKKYNINSIPDYISNKVRRDIIKKRYGMNPQQTWYDTNPELRTAMDSYYRQNLTVLQKWNDLYCDVEDLYEHGTAKEKILAISLIGSVKLFQ